MSQRERRWNELQDRFAQGDVLSAEEEDQRRAYAEHDALARRELQLFAELRARAASPEVPPSPALIARALEGARGGPPTPHLRLVTSSGSDDLGEMNDRASRSASRRKRLAVGALALTAAAAAAVGVSQRQLPPSAALPSAHVTEPIIHARAELVLAAGEVRVAGKASQVGQRLLAAGEPVSTGQGRACLTIDPGIDVCLAEDSQIELVSLVSKRVKVHVTRGVALASLTRRDAGSSFALVAGDVSATAQGTTYAMRRRDGATEVTVVEGAVEVAHASGEREMVGAHSRVILPASSTMLTRTPVGRNEEARLLGLRSMHELWKGAAVGVLEVASTPLMQEASIDDGGALPLPLQAFVSAGVHQVSWHDAAGAETTSWIEVASGETRRLAPPDRPSAVAREAVQKPSAASLLERARGELGRGQPRQALALYEQLRTGYPASAEARTVLITMGKLELELGQAKRALAHYEDYLRSGGSLAPEALAGRARSLRALGRTQEERRAIQQYLASHPNGFEAPLFAKRLRELTPP